MMMSRIVTVVNAMKGLNIFDDRQKLNESSAETKSNSDHRNSARGALNKDAAPSKPFL